MDFDCFYYLIIEFICLVLVIKFLGIFLLLEYVRGKKILLRLGGGGICIKISIFVIVIICVVDLFFRNFIFIS